MPVSKETLKGYILEEILAYLIRNTGYRLLTKPSDDPEDLTMARGNLVVKGRGALHQVDVLGQLEWVPAFTYPIRLFVEAKFRGNRIGLPVVRNAVGVVLDINQKYQTIKGTDKPVQRHHYAYSLFSMSGFTDTAQDMAIAHQISLVDLSGLEYQPLADGIDLAATRILLDDSRSGVVYNLRIALRESLRTTSQDRDHSSNRYNPSLVEELKVELRQVIRVARGYDELFVGMANGPFMLLLKAREPARFLQQMRDSPRTRVIITWSPAQEAGRLWRIRPVDPSEEAFELEFRLPNRLAQWVFGVQEESEIRALDVKRLYFPKITIFRRDENADRLFSLEFDRIATERYLQETQRRFIH